MKNFALIGAAGFVAERHLKAIKETGNNLIAAIDPFDVVGRLDSYFPSSEFFTKFSDFENFIRQNKPDYTSICSPNHLHLPHIQSVLNAGSNAICEKPLALSPNELESIEKEQTQSGKQVYNILQLRLHPAIIELRHRILEAPKNTIYDIDLTYITSRGKWYFESWKGDPIKSGGLVTNIGIHFFDMLMWIFGTAEKNQLFRHEPSKASGTLMLKNARVRWFLSLDYNDIPESIKSTGARTYRSLKLNGEEFEFSEGFTDLHTLSYKHILEGNGFSVSEAEAGIRLTHQIRNLSPVAPSGDYHPFLYRKA